MNKRIDYDLLTGNTIYYQNPIHHDHHKYLRSICEGGLVLPAQARESPREGHLFHAYIHLNVISCN